MPLGLSTYLTKEDQLLEDFVPAEKIRGTFQNPNTLGRGSIRFDLTTLGEASSASIAAGNFVTFSLTLNTAPKIRSNPIQFWDIYIDNDNNAAWRYPSGASLTSSNTPLLAEIGSLVNTDFNTGKYVWQLVIKNNDTIAHTYHVDARGILPVIPAQAQFGQSQA